MASKEAIEFGEKTEKLQKDLFAEAMRRISKNDLDVSKVADGVDFLAFTGSVDDVLGEILSHASVAGSLMGLLTATVPAAPPWEKVMTTATRVLVDASLEAEEFHRSQAAVRMSKKVED